MSSRLLLEPRGHPGGHGIGDDRAHGRRAEHLLGLPLELRLGQAHREHSGQAGQDVLLLELVRSDLEPARVLLDLGAQELHESLLESGLVRSALRRGDDVDVAAKHRVVSGPPAQGDIDLALAVQFGRDHVAVLLQHGHRLGVRPGALDAPGRRERSVGRQEVDEFADPTREPEGLAIVGALAAIQDVDPEPGNQERGLTCPVDEFVELESGALREDLRVGPVTDPRAGRTLGDLSDHPQLAVGGVGGERRVRGRAHFSRRIGGVGEHPRLAPSERHGPGLAVAVDLDVETLGQRVHHRRTHTVEPAGGGVRPRPELSAGVKLGEDDLDPAQPGLRLDVDRDAASRVAHLHAVVGVQHHLDLGSVAGKGLVHRVVDDLPQAVHQPARIGGTDVHARPLSNRLKPSEHRQLPCRIV